MELRAVTIRVTIQRARGKSLADTEHALRNALARLGYVREITVTESKPEREPCRACRNGFPLEMSACPSCGRTRDENKPQGPESSARTVTETDAWGVTRVVGGHGGEIGTDKPQGTESGFPDDSLGIRGNVDALAESWRNGNRSTVIKALSVLDGPFAALMAAYLHHEFADEYDRGVFARLLQRACDEHKPEGK